METRNNYSELFSDLEELYHLFLPEAEKPSKQSFSYESMGEDFEIDEAIEPYQLFHDEISEANFQSFRAHFSFGTSFEANSSGVDNFPVKSIFFVQFGDAFARASQWDCFEGHVDFGLRILSWMSNHVTRVMLYSVRVFTISSSSFHFFVSWDLNQYIRSELVKCCLSNSLQAVLEAMKNLAFKGDVKFSLQQMARARTRSSWNNPSPLLRISDYYYVFILSNIEGDEEQRIWTRDLLYDFQHVLSVYPVLSLMHMMINDCLKRQPFRQIHLTVTRQSADSGTKRARLFSNRRQERDQKTFEFCSFSNFMKVFSEEIFHGRESIRPFADSFQSFVHILETMSTHPILMNHLTYLVSPLKKIFSVNSDSDLFRQLIAHFSKYLLIPEFHQIAINLRYLQMPTPQRSEESSEDLAIEEDLKAPLSPLITSNRLTTGKEEYEWVDGVEIVSFESVEDLIEFTSLEEQSVKESSSPEIESPKKSAESSPKGKKPKSKLNRKSPEVTQTSVPDSISTILRGDFSCLDDLINQEYLSEAENNLLVSMLEKSLKATKNLGNIYLCQILEDYLDKANSLVTSYQKPEIIIEPFEPKMFKETKSPGSEDQPSTSSGSSELWKSPEYTSARFPFLKSCASEPCSNHFCGKDCPNPPVYTLSVILKPGKDRPFSHRNEVVFEALKPPTGFIDKRWATIAASMAPPLKECRVVVPVLDKDIVELVKSSITYKSKEILDIEDTEDVCDTKDSESENVVIEPDVIEIDSEPAKSEIKEVDKSPSPSKNRKVERELRRLMNVSFIDIEERAKEVEDQCPQCEESSCLCSNDIINGKRAVNVRSGSRVKRIRLAPEEQTWHQTVILDQNQDIKIVGAPEREKREKKLPARFRNHVLIGREALLNEGKKVSRVVPKGKEAIVRKATRKPEEDSCSKKPKLDDVLSDSSVSSDSFFSALKPEQSSTKDTLEETPEQLIWCMIHSRYDCKCSSSCIVDLKINSIVSMPTVDDEEKVLAQIYNWELNSARTFGTPFSYMKRNQSNVYTKKRANEIKKSFKASRSPFYKLTSELQRAVDVYTLDGLGSEPDLMRTDLRIVTVADCRLSFSYTFLNTEQLKKLGRGLPLFNISCKWWVMEMSAHLKLMQYHPNEPPIRDTVLAEVIRLAQRRNISTCLPLNGKSLYFSNHFGVYAIYQLLNVVVIGPFARTENHAVTILRPYDKDLIKVPFAKKRDLDSVRGFWLGSFPDMNALGPATLVDVTDSLIRKNVLTMSNHSVGEGCSKEVTREKSPPPKDETGDSVSELEDSASHEAPTLLNDKPPSPQAIETIELDDSNESDVSSSESESSTIKSSQVESDGWDMRKPASMDKAGEITKKEGDSGKIASASVSKVPKHSYGLICLTDGLGYIPVTEYSETKITIQDPGDDLMYHTFFNLNAACSWLNSNLRTKITFSPPSLVLDWIIVKPSLLQHVSVFDKTCLTKTMVISENGLTKLVKDPEAVNVKPAGNGIKTQDLTKAFRNMKKKIVEFPINISNEGSKSIPGPSRGESTGNEKPASPKNSSEVNGSTSWSLKVKRKLAMKNKVLPLRNPETHPKSIENTDYETIDLEDSGDESVTPNKGHSNGLLKESKLLKNKSILIRKASGRSSKRDQDLREPKRLKHSESHPETSLARSKSANCFGSNLTPVRFSAGSAAETGSRAGRKSTSQILQESEDVILRTESNGKGREENLDPKPGAGSSQSVALKINNSFVVLRNLNGTSADGERKLITLPSLKGVPLKSFSGATRQVSVKIGSTKPKSILLTKLNKAGLQDGVKNIGPNYVLSDN